MAMNIWISEHDIRKIHEVLLGTFQSKWAFGEARRYSKSYGKF